MKNKDLIAILKKYPDDATIVYNYLVVDETPFDEEVENVTFNKNYNVIKLEQDMFTDELIIKKANIWLKNFLLKTSEDLEMDGIYIFSQRNINETLADFNDYLKK